MAKRSAPVDGFDKGPARNAGKAVDKRAVIATLCQAMAAGESVRAFARRHGHSEATLRLWASENAEDAAQYARAREAQADAVFDELDELARSAVGLPGEQVQGYRLAVDALKWRASKLAPKSYGEKAQVEHTGRDGGPVRLTVAYEDEDA